MGAVADNGRAKGLNRPGLNRRGQVDNISLNPVDPRPGPADLPYPRIHDESLRGRAAVMDPRDDFDQTGFTWPSAPVDPADASGQAELFADDYARPDAAASEPVFWTEPTRPDDQRHPSADAPESA